MDMSFANAVRNASSAWAQNRTTDTATMQELTRRYTAPTSALQHGTAVPNAGQMGILQPELARYGQLGTKLNLYA